jgi:hypothetical protein
MAQTPEGKIKSKLRRKLTQYDVWIYVPQAGAFGKAGIPDILVLANGTLIGLECKADAKKKPTDLQVKTMKDMEAAGAPCMVVYDDATIDQAIHLVETALGLSDD